MGTIFVYFFLGIIILMIALIPRSKKDVKTPPVVANDEEEMEYEEVPPFEARFCIMQTFVADNSSYTTIGVPYVLSYFNYSETHDTVEKLIIAAESTHYFTHDSSRLLEAIEDVSRELMCLQPMGKHASFEFFSPSDTRFSFVVHILRIK